MFYNFFQKKILVAISCFLTINLIGQEITKKRPVATYSIVARDSITGQMGVAVQSHWFSVGPTVAWAEAGVGAIATQSITDPNYGFLGLKLMKSGKTSPEVLKALLSMDSSKGFRQVGMVDNNGQACAHTGSKAIKEAGHIVGKQYTVQANLMEKSSVWEAMASGYENAQGDLADKLLAALEAAQNEGGDLRGKQSAAIIIVAPTRTGKPWIDNIFDLRVEDHPEPIQELKRLIAIQRAYHYLNKGDKMIEVGSSEEAMGHYKKSMELLPDAQNQGESAFWVGVTLTKSGHVDEAIGYFKRAYKQNQNWAILLERLPESGLFPDDPKLLKTIQKKMKKK